MHIDDAPPHHSWIVSMEMSIPGLFREPVTQALLYPPGLTDPRERILWCMDNCCCNLEWAIYLGHYTCVEKFALRPDIYGDAFYMAMAAFHGDLTIVALLHSHGESCACSSVVEPW